MRNKAFFSTFFILVITQSISAQSVKLSPAVKAAMEQVKADDIKADITYLASDDLKGRMPGTPGFEQAVSYVVGHLEALKVKPAGENGTWLQTVRLRRAFTQNASLSINYDALNNTAVRKGNDCVIYPNPIEREVKLSAPLVFAGYGVSEPALGYDDYAGLDVKGKVIVIIRGAPDSFASSVSAHVSNTTTLLKVAAQHGAVGVIVASADSTVTTLPNIRRGAYSVLGDKGQVVISRSYYSEQVKFMASARFTMLSFLFHNANKNWITTIADIKAGKPRSFIFNSTVNFYFK